MADNDKIPDKVMDALIENTKTIEANNAVLSAMADSKEKTSKKDENIVETSKVNATLSAEEKTRYANIGKELFSPVLSSLSKLIKREKKKNEMIIKDDAETIQDAVKVQYENKPNEEAEGNGSSWLPILLGVLAVAGAAVYLFKDKIVDFFDQAWTWIKDVFGSIVNFFDFGNKESPIVKILDTIGSVFGGLWDLVKKAFTKLAGLGGEIWNMLKKGWDKFITGPDGILNFGVKIVKGIVDFAKNAVSNIGGAIKDAVMGPIKRIFGGAEEEGKEAGEAAAAEVKVQANQAVADSAAKQKAITDDVIFNADKANQAIIDSAKEQREAVRKEAASAGLKVDEDGKINKESIKLKAAEESLKEFLKSQGADFNNLDAKQQEEIKKLMAEHVNINDKGEAHVDMGKVKEALNKAKSDGWLMDSKEINLLQEANQENINSMQASLQSSLGKYMQMNADIQAANNLENMTEEEKFEARLRQAMATGKTAEFRFMEGRKMIKESTQTIKDAFVGYDKTIRDNFTSTWKMFMLDFLDQFKLEINTVAPQDNSKNSYVIMPMNRHSLATMTSNLLRLSKIATETLIAQNKVLDKIKGLLAEPPPQKIILTSEPAEELKEKVEDGVNYIASTAKKHLNDLWNSVNPWA